MTRRLFLQQLALSVAAGAAAAALNTFGPTMRLLPGRVLTLPIAILWGPAFGGIAALLGALPFARIFPVFLIILGAEGLLVGAFVRRGRSSLMAGAFVWVTVAATLALKPDWFGVEHLRSMIGPLALRQLLNGMIAVVIADLVAVVAAASLQWARADNPPRLRAYAFHVFLLVAILPVLILSAVNGEVFAARRETDGAARLHEAAAAMRDHIDEYMNTHVRAVQALAAAAAQAGGDTAKRQRLIAQHREIYGDFITTFIADRNGVVHEIEPARPGNSVNQIRDRPYFTEAMRTGRPAISDVILGRVSHQSIVTIAVPIPDASGAPDGVAGGSLSLSNFQRFLQEYGALPGATIIVADQHSRLISASAQSGFVAQQDLAHEPLVQASPPSRDGVFGYMKVNPGGVSAAQIGAVATIGIGWKVFVGQPVVSLRTQSIGYYALTLALMLLALGGAVLGARGFSGA
ncbi:MAG TPA: cache domain-containing protein, partial [Vicinamibacterales bacterium]|nr:cache domain-containing protein [Vicinamibacterales bacterium]